MNITKGRVLLEDATLTLSFSKKEIATLLATAKIAREARDRCAEARSNFDDMDADTMLSEVIHGVESILSGIDLSELAR